MSHESKKILTSTSSTRTHDQNLENLFPDSPSERETTVGRAFPDSPSWCSLGRDQRTLATFTPKAPLHNNRPVIIPATGARGSSPSTSLFRRYTHATVPTFRPAAYAASLRAFSSGTDHHHLSNTNTPRATRPLCRRLFPDVTSAQHSADFWLRQENASQKRSCDDGAGEKTTTNERKMLRAHY